MKFSHVVIVVVVVLSDKMEKTEQCDDFHV